MATLITFDDIAKAVKAVWPAAGGITSANVYLNRRPAQVVPPYGIIRITEGEPTRESDGIVFQRFTVTVQAVLMDATLTRTAGQAIASIPRLLIDSGLLHWPAGVPIAPDVVPGGSGTIETDPRLRSADDVYTLPTRFTVVIQPAIP